MNLRKFRKEIILMIDLFITAVIGVTLFILLPESNGAGSKNIYLLLPHLVLLISCQVVSQLCFKTYESLWRYAESEEYLYLLTGGGTGFTIFIILDRYLFDKSITVSFLISTFTLSLLGMLFMRLYYRHYCKYRRKRMTENKLPIIIIGAGEAGVKLQEEINGNPNSRYRTICFLDDSIEKVGKLIHGIEVKGPIVTVEKFVGEKGISEIIIAMPSVSPERRKEILKLCFGLKCRVRILPDTMTLLNENNHNLWNYVRDVWIEEIMGRDQVSLYNEEVKEFLHQKVIMVTGGGGSIGTELCRQIALADPAQIIIVDIYENNAYEIQQELVQMYGDKITIKVEIASIRDEDKVDQLFRRYRPNVVFHAAAHKHVPLMEDCPDEAIKNNIMGTYHMVKAADRYQVDKFVQISTDKAVNPTSVMGATKRFCEMILQSMKDTSKTEFVAVRFGNVLGSNGSVIPLFQKQIAKGGPVTVTDMRIVRYFMTITEAVQLVLQAGAMANSSEVYVLDMGQPVKIIDLAENLIRISGHVPYTEIMIKETGLRPGEKLYEELLMNSEELIATPNHKIFIEQQNGISQSEIEEKLEILLKAVESGSSEGIKEAMKTVVPTYREPNEYNES